MPEETVQSKLKAKVWLTSREASDLMSELHGREITADYVRLLGRQGIIKTQPLDGRTTLFSKRDCEKYPVNRRTDKRVDVRARDRRTGGKPGRPRKASATGQEKQSEGEHALDLVG